MATDRAHSRPRLVAIGELLWDLFPDGARLGGAPANVAAHAAALGADAALVSRVGRDAEGVRALRALAARGAASREAVQRFVAAAPEGCLRVLDLNFRQHDHSEAVVRASLGLADVLKLSREEVAVLRNYVDGPGEEGAFLAGVREQFSIGWAVLTLGAEGCRIIGPGVDETVPAKPQRVLDAVGAGDAFTAAFALHLLSGANARACAERANAVGGYVVTQAGGMPPLPEEFRVF